MSIGARMLQAAAGAGAGAGGTLVAAFSGANATGYNDYPADPPPYGSFSGTVYGGRTLFKMATLFGGISTVMATPLPVADVQLTITQGATVVASELIPTASWDDNGDGTVSSFTVTTFVFVSGQTYGITLS